MERLNNPFYPGAGAPPRELAGREVLREDIIVTLKRIKKGFIDKSTIMVGLRGVGKTVLLDALCNDAEALDINTIRIEAPENKSLPALLTPQLRLALLRISRSELAKDYAKRALQALAGFAKGLKVKYKDIEVGLDYEPEVGLADNGDLEHDLQALFEVAGVAARHAKTALVLFIDEMQYVEEDEFAALITALHRAAQKQLPICLVGAGLPTLRGRAGNAKSYAERLFDFPVVGELTSAATALAITKPLALEGVSITDDALAELVQATHGYPYFIQEWGKHTWSVATQSPITVHDVRAATPLVIAALDENFFKVRYDRLTPSEKRYLRAMAQLGPGPHRSGEVADCLGKPVTKLSLARNNLIRKGMIWSPNHGDTAFTVPLFDEFMRRMMPNEDWRS